MNFSKKINIGGLLVIAFGMISGCNKGTTSAEVVSARIVPSTNAQGRPIYMVLVDWKNTGNTPIRSVHADISILDPQGKKLDVSAKDYTIYVVSSDNPGIAPGETYTEPNDKGYALESGMGGTAASADINITRVSSEGLKF